MTPDPAARYLSDPLTRLRPMASGEIMDQAMRIYRANGASLLSSAALPSLFCLAAIAFFTGYVWPALQVTRDPESATTQIGEAAVLLLMGVGVGSILFIIGLTASAAKTVAIVSEAFLGTTSGDRKESIVPLPRLFLLMGRELATALGGPLAGVALILLGGFLSTVTDDSSALAGIIAVIGIAGLLGGSVYLLAVFASRAVVLPVAILEGLPGSEAVRRSRRLMMGTRYHSPGSATVWSLYGVLIIVALVILAGTYATFDLFGLRAVLEEVSMGSPIQGMLLTAVDLLPAFLMVWTLVPIWACTITVIYYERRIRLEGYDIHVLASRIR